MSAHGAAAAAMIQAVKASGVVVRVQPTEFMSILRRHQEPLVVHAPAGFLGRRHRYLTAYKGLVFFTHAQEPLSLPGAAEVVEAGKIWVPG